MISLGVDIGGTGCKCAAFGEDGGQLALAYREYPLTLGSTAIRPQDLLEAVLEVIARCADALPEKQTVAAITVSSFGESYVAVDAQGNPVEDILLYYASSRNPAFDRVVAQVGKERMMEIARIYPDEAFSLSKVLRTVENARCPVDKFLFIACFVVWSLSGEAVCDPSLATRTLMFDVLAGCWSKEILSAARLDESQLPRIVPTGTAVGTLLPGIAQRLGLSSQVQVVMGAQDQIVNALGAGVQHWGDAVDTSGTCECITPLFAQPPALSLTARNFACVPYLDGAGFVSYGYNLSAGSVVRWYRDALAQHLRGQAEAEGCSLYDILNRICPQDPTSLVVLPYLQGMGGTPDVNHSATGWITGLTTSTTLPEIYRAILEGLCFEMRYNLEMLQSNGIAPTRLLASGGGARSQVWLQIKADIWNCEIIPVLTEETGALGSAILGLAAVTGEKDRLAMAARFVQYGAPVKPNPARKAYYDEQYVRFLKLRTMARED